MLANGVLGFVAHAGAGLTTNLVVPRQGNTNIILSSFVPRFEI